MTTPVTKPYWEPLGAVGLPSEPLETTAVDVSAAAIAARQVRDAERAQFWATVHGVAHQARAFYDSIPTRVDATLPTIVKIPLAPALIAAGECHGLTRLALDTVTGIPETMAAAFAGEISLSALPSATKELLVTEWDRIAEIPTHIMNGALMSAGSNTGYVGGEVVLLISGVGSMLEAGAMLGRLGAMTTRIITQSGRAALIMSQDLLASGANYLKSLSTALEDLTAGLMPEMATAGIPNSYAMVANHGPGRMWSGNYPKPPKPLAKPSRRPSNPQIRQEAVPQDPKAMLVERGQLSRFIAEQFGVSIDRIEHALHQLGAPVRLPSEFQYLPSSKANLNIWPRDARKYIVKGPTTTIQIGYVPPGGAGLYGETVPQGRVFIIELPKKS